MRPGSLSLRLPPRSRRFVLAGVAAAVVVVLVWFVTGPLHQARADEVPLSQGRPVTASSVEGGAVPAAAAVDGNATTRWSSAFSDPQWLQVDLGASAAIGRVVLNWERAYAAAFQIQVSTDGTTWTPVYTTTTGTGGTQTLTVSGQGRYVRMYGTARATAYGYSLWEFQVFGTAAGPQAPASAPASPTAVSGSSVSGSGDGWVMADPPVTGVVPSRVKGPSPSGFHEFQANCAVSHHKPDDPIVFFNQPGASHDHTFMGNSTTDAASTTSSLQAGGTLCVTPGDKSGYWMPTMYNGDQVVLPVGPQVIYYKSGVDDYRTVRPAPPGLRYVVGSPKTTFEQFKTQPGTVENWECGDSTFNVDFPASCPAERDKQLVIRMFAPSCWDGLHLDSPDHKSHMAYPRDFNGVLACPDDHPVAVPKIEFKMAFPVNGDLSKVRLSSGRGYSFHYDVFNLWDPATLDTLVKYCINGARQCLPNGLDLQTPGSKPVLDDLYQVPGSHTVLNRSGWTATAGVSGDGAAKMLDGNADTRWTTGTPMTGGQSVIVDMHGTHAINQIVFDAPGQDWARGYEVFLSTDGTNWSGPVVSGVGFIPRILATFDKQDARYIKIVQTANDSHWWSITELNAYS